ncbi:MAG: hypothetical protein ABIJ92_04595 [Candidatus Aenigmatarchaeota archaeon]
MGKLQIQDDCLAPDRFSYVKYQGPNSFDVVKRISGSLKPFFHVSSSGTAQTQLNWDVSSDPTSFFSKWWVRVKLSRHSDAYIKIKVQGHTSKKDKSGDFSLQLQGAIRTSFGGKSIILKPIWYMYSYLFYDRVRQGYIAKCRNLILNYRNGIKDYFAIEKTDTPTSHGVYG